MKTVTVTFRGFGPIRNRQVEVTVANLEDAELAARAKNPGWFVIESVVVM